MRIPARTWIDLPGVRQNIIVILRVTITAPFVPGATGLRFCGGSHGGTVRQIHDMERLYAASLLIKGLGSHHVFKRLFAKMERWPVMEGYLSEPLIYPSDVHIAVDVRGELAKQWRVVLGGFVVERKGTTVAH